MKELLIETIPFNVSPVQLTEGMRAPSGNPMVEGILATAEVKNGNGRYYSKDLWEREIDKYQQSVKENRATGELDHPGFAQSNCHTPRAPLDLLRESTLYRLSLYAMRIAH